MTVGREINSFSLTSDVMEDPYSMVCKRDCSFIWLRQLAIIRSTARKPKRPRIIAVRLWYKIYESLVRTEKTPAANKYENISIASAKVHITLVFELAFESFELVSVPIELVSVSVEVVELVSVPVEVVELEAEPVETVELVELEAETVELVELEAEPAELVDLEAELVEPVELANNARNRGAESARTRCSFAVGLTKVTRVLWNLSGMGQGES